MTSISKKVMKAISWNWRGLGEANKVEEIKYIIRHERPDLLLIQETKMSDVEVLALSQHCWKNNQGKSLALKGPQGKITFFSSKYDIKNIEENQY